VAQLTYVDNGDGTGGVFQVTGGVAGEAHRIMISRYAGGLFNDPWVEIGSRVGDGGVPAVIATGPYHAFIVSNNGGADTYSAPIGMRSSDGSPSLHSRCAQAIKDYVIGLSIPGIPADPAHHVVTKVGAKLEQVIDGAAVRSAMYYIPVAESIFPADNQYNTVRFPVVLALLVESSQTLARGLGDILRFREIVEQSLAICDLGVPEIHTINFQPGAVVDPSRWLQGYDSSVLTLVCVTERRAGLV
jgi:hypothetical protein